jgi:plasmid stabilization system protein ParE
MGCKIIFSPRTIADLEEVVRHIARDDPVTAVRIGNGLIDCVAILEKFPMLGALYPKRPGVRKLVSRPYLIFYRFREEENVVDILRYWHGAQREPHL